VSDDEVAEQVGGHVVGHPGDRGRVLHGDGNAGKRARIVLRDPLGRRQGALRVDVDERVQRGLKLLDALERRGHQLGRADLPAANERRELRSRPGEKLSTHGRGAYCVRGERANDGTEGAPSGANSRG
jgi:hypothetical protein